MHNANPNLKMRSPTKYDQQLQPYMNPKKRIQSSGQVKQRSAESQENDELKRQLAMMQEQMAKLQNMIMNSTAHK